MNERRGTKGLELWCRKMTEGYPGVKIDNMTTSWRDGLAFCAIIHHFRPDLIDFSKLNKDDVYHNNELAFRIAEQFLGIPALLEPEDMVEYSVPDRLSILTYLSQFYQAFAVREGASPARIAPKRPQSSTDHGIVSPASTSPPTKVALTGTNLRRDPCTKCGLPVFIAERFNVGKSLFHRTCFRCARCSSQLTIANCYETENNEYCCEICPDEEKVMSKSSAQNAVLQRSMSDEEKTANLKIVSNEPDEFSAMFETALENADIEKVQTLTREFDSARSNFFQSQIVESSDSGNEEASSKEDAKPPDLPVTQLPVISAQNSIQYDSGFPSKDVSVINSFSGNLESQNVVTKESVVKSRMRLFENDLKADVNSKKVPLSPNASIPISIKRVDNSISEIKEDTKHSEDQESKASSGKDFPNKKQFTTSISLKLDRGDNNVVENQDTSIITISDTSLDHSIPSSNESKESSGDIITIDDSIEDSTSKIDEAIEAINTTIISLQDSSEHSNFSKTGSCLDETSEPSNFSQMESFEETDKESKSHSSKIEPFEPQDTSQQNEDSKILSSHSEPNDISFIDEEPAEDTNETAETTNFNVKCSFELESKTEETIESVNYKDNLEEEKIVETVNHSVKVSEHKPVEAVNNLVKDRIDKEPAPKNEIIEEKSPPKPDFRPVLEKIESYPEDLNPFDDEVEVSPPKASLNPFGSDDDDDDDEENIIEALLRKPIPSPRFKKKCIDASAARISLNPFESDDEDDDKPPVPATRRKKISAPKFTLSPWSDDEEKHEEVTKKPVPLPRDTRTSSRLSELKPREPNSLSISSHNFGGSNSSISSDGHYGSARKKRPAPKPPIPGILVGSNSSSVASTPSHSVPHSPKSTPKLRKDRRAPPPPNFTSTPNPPDKNEEKSSTELPKESANQDDLHQEKTGKDEANRNLQNTEDPNKVSVLNKSTYGKWKRKKGQAPAKPVPPQRRTLKCLPMAEIKKELEFIEIQQQGLEKQGVRLEQIIREKCEGTPNTDSANLDDDIPIEVEDLILQLFELVNEKNELFRKQTELMYLRRQQRLEEEHADIEYQIRCLMIQPEANKTDSDKAHEEELIQRLVEIVERRNEIVECLEKDRVREAEEDDSITNHINLFTLSRDSQSEKSKPKSEKSKKEKKKEKKKLKNKSKEKMDVDKDVDETETSMNTLEKKKKKKFNLF